MISHKAASSLIWTEKSAGWRGAGETVFAITLIALGIAATLAIIRATIGPTSFDRVLAVNTIGTIAVLLIAVYGFLTGDPNFSTLRCFMR